MNVALGGCPFEDQMRLDIWKKAQRTTTLMIRVLHGYVVDVACRAGDSYELVSYLPSVIHYKCEQSLCREMT